MLCRHFYSRAVFGVFNLVSVPRKYTESFGVSDVLIHHYLERLIPGISYRVRVDFHLMSSPYFLTLIGHDRFRCIDYGNRINSIFLFIDIVPKSTVIVVQLSWKEAFAATPFFYNPFFQSSFSSNLDLPLSFAVRLSVCRCVGVSVCMCLSVRLFVFRCALCVCHQVLDPRSSHSRGASLGGGPLDRYASPDEERRSGQEGHRGEAVTFFTELRESGICRLFGCLLG